MLVLVEQGGIVLEIVGDLIGIADDPALMFLDLDLGDIERVA